LADSSDALESMQKVHEQLGGMPVVNLVYARQRAKAGNHKRAVKLYRSLPPLILRSPIMIVELATAQANMGEIDQALSTLSSMHAKGAFSKASLELFRDLTFRRQLNDKSKAAQTLLEKKYPGDAGVQYSGALMALREGKVDSAVSILAQLAKKHPEEERFELSRLSALLLTRDYDRVIEEINASTAPKDALASLKARAYRRKGDLPGAEEALRKGLEQRRSPRLLLEYADILIAQEKHDRAAEVYREIMTEHEEELAKDSSGNAMLLNNFAWARISSGNSDDQALDAARKAHTLAPLNPHILDTYATGLLKKGEWKECINLLEDDSVVTKEPRLLVHLATALEKRNKINRAVRTYREAYDMSASGTALPLGISREELNGRIERLLADH
jgi:predicted Zn-dependent protease